MLATLAALVLTWLSFAPALSARFVSDDVNAIAENEWVMGPFNPAGIVANHSWWGTSRYDSVAWRPGATLTFAIDHLWSGADPSGYRAVNFVLHAICAGLVFALARSLGLALEAAAVAGALFALLPIHSEAVIWIVGRAELGAAIGFLVAVLACLAYRRGGSPTLLVLAAASVAVGMTFKENAVTALAAPAIFFLTRRDESVGIRRDAVATGALVLGFAAWALLRASASGAGTGPDAGDLLDNPLSVVDPLTRLLGALAVFGRYVSLTFWPSSLSVDYSYDALGIGSGFRANADSGIALVFLAAATWAALARRRVVATGLMLAAAAFSIVSNTVLVIGTILGERLFYLPTAGLCVAGAALLEPFVARARDRGRASWVPGAVLATVGLAAIGVNRHRAGQWLTPVSLFESAVASAPRSARAQMELGTALSNAGRTDEAIGHFAKALEILPSLASAAYNQGNALARAQRYDEAAASYRRAVEADPHLVQAWHNLALTEKLRGRSDAWIQALGEAVRIAPRSTDLRTELADGLLGAGRYEQAIAEYDTLISQGIETAVVHYNRGVAHHHLGGCAAAVDDYRLATRAPAAPSETFAAAASCLRQLGRSDEAAAIEQSGKVANRGTRR